MTRAGASGRVCGSRSGAGPASPALAGGPALPAARLEARHQLHLPFPDVALGNAALLVDGDDVAVAVAPAERVAQAELVAGPQVGHALVVNVVALAPPGGGQVLFQVRAALLVGRVPEVGHARVQGVSVGRLQVVLGLGRQLGRVAVGALRLRLLLRLVQERVSPLGDERRLELLGVQLQPRVVPVHQRRRVGHDGVVLAAAPSDAGLDGERELEVVSLAAAPQVVVH